MIRVIIADDHPIIREGLKKIFEQSAGIRVMQAVDSGEALLDCLVTQTFDLLLLDITLPGRSGIAILSDIKRIAPSLGVLMISMHAEDQYAIRALKAGADGYITKDKAPDELILAVQKVAAGRKYISSGLAETLANDLVSGSSDVPHERLSDREHQVLCLIAQGKTVGEIAQLLSLSVSTISTYHQRIFEKMGMKSNAELIRYAIENNLLE